MSHGTHVDESCHTYQCNATRVVRLLRTHTRMNESRHTRVRDMSQVWVMSHLWMQLIASRASAPHIHTCVNESRHARGWVMAHISMQPIKSSVSASYTHTYEWVTAHTWKSQGTHINATYRGPCVCFIYTHARTASYTHTHEWIMAHIWMNHITHVTHETLNSHLYVYVCYHSRTYTCHTEAHAWPPWLWMSVDLLELHVRVCVRVCVCVLSLQK